MKTDKEIQKSLRKSILASTAQRFELMYLVVIITSIGNLIYDFIINPFPINLEHKCVCMFSLMLGHLQQKILKKYPWTSVFMSLAIGEMYNFLLLYYAHNLFPEVGILWGQVAIYVTYFYQSFMIIGFKSCFVFSFKQTLIWSIPKLYSTSKEFNLSELISAVFTLYIVSLFCSLSNYYKDIDIFKAKYEKKILSDQMSLIVETIPECISVITVDLKEVFSNSCVKVLTKNKALLIYLKDCVYNNKFNNTFDENTSIFDDIVTSLTYPIETQVSFGVVSKNECLFEWSGKIVAWDGTKSIILSGKNVTNVVKAEKENATNAYKSALINTISHELRTPTNAILTVGSLIKQSSELSAINSERIDIVLGSCTYQLCLINDLLDYAQVIAGSLKISTLPVNINNLILECANCIVVQLDSKIELIKVLKDIPEVLITDPNRLKQILLNLLSNARKFTKEGSITLEVSYSPPELTISCKDTGIGISEEDLSKIFTKFGKIENSSGMNPQGVGLGLFISNMLVKKLGGTGIKVFSKVDQGSTFGFTIIVDEPNNEIDIPEEGSFISLPCMFMHSLSHKTEILIVDDTYFNIMAVAQLLKVEGIGHSYALSGKEAIEKILSNQYSCVLMDCEMSEMDGWEATKSLINLSKEDCSIKLPPIIGTSAHSEDEIKEKCLSSGMCDFIPKPCAREVIMQKISHWILSKNS